MFFVHRLVCLVIGYCFGLIQTAYLLGKMHHVDIRQYGSGNSGTTNALRTLGKTAGLITFLVDGFKAVFAVLIVRTIFKDSTDVFVLSLYAGFGTVIGHNFPFYMNFKGGKGIAASAGVILACFDLKLLLLGICTFTLIVALTRYVSLGSLCVMTGFLIELIVFGELGLMSEVSKFSSAHRFETYGVAFVMTLLAYIRHKENIKRLLNGTERKLGEKKERIDE
ncbi:MAG: glycerol-3-phosphate 1-O-acyltransferase PlsY [Lachnospiraceae bacterium]|nr:glycerol-3-phosphate 1-O-acyltransferase PlsY [Lachnospiraceae bacterium]